VGNLQSRWTIYKSGDEFFRKGGAFTKQVKPLGKEVVHLGKGGGEYFKRNVDFTKKGWSVWKNWW
jgi:hypothetical protein